MENYLKEFNTHSEYETFKAGTDFIRPNVSICNLEDDVHYNGHDYFEDYLTFKALEDGTFSFSEADMKYSLNNGETWTTLTAGTNTPTISAGSKIIWKSSGSVGSAGPGIFSSTGKFEVMGNAMSLVNNDHFTEATTEVDLCQFKSLFSGCIGLISAKNLSLPATELSRESYCLMFQGCTSLTTAPVLPATTLAVRCYESMFEGCTSLNSVTCLATDIDARDCTNSWLYGVASSGTFTKAASMTSWTTGVHGIPEGWTVQTASA